MDDSVVYVRQSDNFFTREENNRIYGAFIDSTGTLFDANTSKRRAWAAFLLFLADGGFSAEITSTKHLIVTTRDPDGNENQEIGETFDDIIEDIEKAIGSRYTHKRLANTNCDLIASLLERRPFQTAYGVKNHIPEVHKKYSFPGAEFCRTIPDSARTALSLAKNYALNRDSESNPSTASDHTRVSIFH